MIHLSGHLSSAVILIASATVALAADRLAAPSRMVAAGALAGAAVGVDSFVARLRPDSLRPHFQLTIPVDPFADRRFSSYEEPVARQRGTSIVPTVVPAGRALTAILIADERRVAVIDEASVRVGDVLRDGARVAAIHPDRVWVVERDGRWRMLTLTDRGQ